jgi:hypothetical protein
MTDLSTVLERISELRADILRASSPWCDRKGAAAYCSCSAGEIDRVANRGDIKRFYRSETPMFKKSGKGSLDAWIEGRAK